MQSDAFSFLGLPFITKRIKLPRGEKKPAVPDNVKKWTNFSDMSDPVCADPCLESDYENNNKAIGTFIGMKTNFSGSTKNREHKNDVKI